MRISLEETAERLKQGEVVAVPTETVYGLAASIAHPKAIGQIFSLKKRPANNPLIVHVSQANSIPSYTLELPYQFDQLAHAFWPGPLTVVLPADCTKIPLAARGGLSTAAFRVPSHPLTLKLLELTGPLVMPSANLSGRPSATTSEHVEQDFGPEFPILEGGACTKGVESTVLCFSGDCWQVIRLGALPAEIFSSVLGYIPPNGKKRQGEAPLCPGQQYRHYAPKAALFLSENIHKDTRTAILGFSDRIYPAACRVFVMGNSTDPEDVTEKLYAALRTLDAEGIHAATVDMDFPRSGLWETVHERLQRAAEHTVS
jgi:L-threonylcarbamoyladenylate synthase